MNMITIEGHLVVYLSIGVVFFSSCILRYAKSSALKLLKIVVNRGLVSSHRITAC